MVSDALFVRCLQCGVGWCRMVQMVYDGLIEGVWVIFNLQLCIYSIASFFQNRLGIY